MKILLDDYKVNQANVCFLGSISDVLLYYGCLVSEEELLALGCGVQFYYLEEKENNRLHITVTSVSLEKNTIQLNNYLKYCNYLLVKQMFKDDTDMIIYIQNSLNLKKPVIVKVDTYYLPYHVEYKKSHYGHIIVVYGMDDDDGKVYIADSYITTLKKSCCQTSMEFFAFLDSILSFCKISNTALNCITVEPFHNRIEVTGKLLKSINQNKIHLYSENIKSSCCGFQAMVMFYNFLLEQRQKNISKNFELQIIDLYKDLTGFGGPAVTRLLYGNYLMKYHFHDSKLVEIASEYIHISKMWSNCSKGLYRCIVYNDLQYLDRVRDMLKEIIEKEKVIFNKLVMYCTNNEVI